MRLAAPYRCPLRQSPPFIMSAVATSAAPTTNCLCDSPTLSVTFLVRTPALKPKRTVWVTGSSDALGKWDAERMLPMRKDGKENAWRVTVTLPRAEPIEYKYVVKVGRRVSSWETIVGNR